MSEKPFSFKILKKICKPFERKKVNFESILMNIINNKHKYNVFYFVLNITYIIFV